MIERIGFIGTGAITEAIVTGLAAARIPPISVWVSPRNAKTSTQLAQTHPFVRVGRSNQEVLDKCDVVCLAVRPQIAEQVIGELQFGSQHHVLSFIATWNSKRLSSMLSEVRHIARLAPLPMVAQRHGSTIVYPADATAREIFSVLGDVVEVENEDAFDTLFAVTGSMGSYFFMLETLTTWLVSRDVPHDHARAYVASLFNGLSNVARDSTDSFAKLSREFSTKGGLNEQMTRELSALGVFDAYEHALDSIHQRIRRNGT